MWNWFIYHVRCVDIVSQGNCVIIKDSKSIRKNPEINDLCSGPYNPLGFIESQEFISNLFHRLINWLLSHDAERDKEKRNNDGWSNELVYEHL
jgi:hypothetical protein